MSSHDAVLGFYNDLAQAAEQGKEGFENSQHPTIQNIAELTKLTAKFAENVEKMEPELRPVLATIWVGFLDRINRILAPYFNDNEEGNDNG